jgi:hydrogenase-4 component E
MVERALELLLVLVIITNFLLLGSSPLGASIRIVAFQGVLLAALPFLANPGRWSFPLFLMAAGSLLVKGMLIPWLLTRALRDVNIRQEVKPYVGFTLSLLAGILIIGFSFWAGSKIRLPWDPSFSLLIPAAVSMLLCGFFLIVSRKKALSQVIGYLVMENGIYVFGVGLAAEQPLVVELGVLLDLFVAVFVMGIALYHINQEFDHIDAPTMDELRDAP